MKNRISISIFLRAGVIAILFTNCIKVKESAGDKILSDIDGNIYTTTTIGTQTWMVENLKTTKYSDGTLILNITVNETWNAANYGVYCDYENTPSISTIYGRLYNWYVVDNNSATKVASNKGKNICPTGWHVPSDAEWVILTDYLGGESVAGAKLKETGISNWINPNSGATNETGFTALPGGNRFSNGSYSNIGSYGNWWSSTENSPTNVWARGIGYNKSTVSRGNVIKQNGFSVRCIKDN